MSARMGVCDDPLGLVFLEKSPKLILDLLEIRLLVEPTAAAMAAYNADEEEIRKIMQLCNETERQLQSGEKCSKADIRFHQVIAVSSKNVVFPRLVPIISCTIEAVAELSSPEALAETVSGHREIANAIAARNQIAAKDAVYLHLIQNRRMISQMLFEKSRDNNPSADET